MTVSAIILTWNRKEDLSNTLDRLQNEKYRPLEVIVVDNGSTDGTATMIAEKYPDVIYLPQENNLGIAGYNIGFKAATGQFLLVLDSDSYPHPEAITRMVSIFEQHPDAGIVAFTVHAVDGEKEDAVPEQASALPQVGYHGAGAGFRREVFDKAGYWYEPFFLYFNEMDHALRVARAGYRILSSPSVVAYHKTSTTSRPSRNAPYYYVRNALWLVWRNYPLLPMIFATINIISLAVEETLHQRTFLYLRAVVDAFKSIFAVFDSRAPVSFNTLQQARIPFRLAFSRWQ